MYYRKDETYKFSCPSEFNAYLKFKDDLREKGITFIDEGGGMFQVIRIVTTGRFEIDKDGDILKNDSKEEK